MIMIFLLYEKTTGEVPSKCWHLMALMLNMITKLLFTCIYILLIPFIGLLLTIITISVAISVAVVIIIVIIVHYDA